MDQKLRVKTIKLSKENIEENLHDTRFDDDDFLHMTPKEQAAKVKNKLNYIKIKNFSASKDTQRVRYNLTEQQQQLTK